MCETYCSNWAYKKGQSSTEVAEQFRTLFLNRYFRSYVSKSKIWTIKKVASSNR